MSLRYLLILSFLSFPSFSFSADEESSVFDEVVVTARQREETLNQYPFQLLL